MKKYKNIISILLIIISFAIYAASFFYTACTLINHDASPIGTFSGAGLFVMGPIGLFVGHLSWLANPFLWIAWNKYLFKNRNKAFLYGIIALLFSLTFLINPDFPNGDEGIHKYTVNIGYYLWVSSVILTVIASYFLAPPANEDALEKVLVTKLIKNWKQISAYILIKLSYLLFVISLGNLIFTLENLHYELNNDYIGLAVLVLGPYGFLQGHFSWLSYIFLFMAWIQLSKGNKNKSFKLAIFSILFALSFLFKANISLGVMGTYAYHVDIGYYLLLTSMVFTAMAAYYQPIKPKNID